MACAIICGRRDGTRNRGGGRRGTAEFYRVVEELPEVKDSLVVEVGEGEGQLVLFLVLAPGTALDDDLRRRIAVSLRRELSPRPMPICMRCPEMMSRVANRLAVTVRSRTAGLVTHGPSFMRRVLAAMRVRSG